MTKSFVADGFTVPQAKSSVTWEDADTLLVATDYGEGSMTASGYPRIVKRWKRGTPLAEATTVFEGRQSDVSASAWVVRTPGYQRVLFVRSIDFYHRETLMLQGDRLVPLDVPGDATPDFMRDALLLSLRSDFTVGGHTFPAGSLIVADAAAWLRGERKA
jgi:prolyl oligopeptidase